MDWGKEALEWLEQRRDYPILVDRNDQPVLLADSLWPLKLCSTNSTLT